MSRLDAAALYQAAEEQCPPDVVEYGRNHKLETFATATWKGGFIAGVRYAQALAEQKRSAS